MVENLEIIYRRLDEIQHLVGNPKNHDLDAIIASIQEFGFLDPLGLSEQSGSDFDGNGRLDALAEMHRQCVERNQPMDPPRGCRADADGMWLVPIVSGIDWLDDDQEMAAAIALNRANEKGGWNLPLLADALQRLQSSGRVRGTGFGEQDIQEVLLKLEAQVMPDPVAGHKEAEDEDDPDLIVCPKCGFRFPRSSSVARRDAGSVPVE